MFNDDDNPKGVFVENSGRRYRLMTLDDFRRFRVLTEDDVGWDEQAIADKYRVHTKDPTPLPGEETSNLKLIRVRAEYPSVPAQILFDAISDSDYRKSWDKDMMEDYPLCGLDEHNEIGYYAAAFPWPLWNRDFCNMRSWMEFTNGEYIIFNHSVPHEKLPPRKEFTRAMSYVTGYYMVPRPDGGCTLNFISHCDPKGAIPHALVNFFMKRAVPDIIKKLEACAEKYVEWSANTYPPGHVPSWRSAPVDWGTASSTMVPTPQTIPLVPHAPSTPQPLNHCGTAAVAVAVIA